MNTPGDNGPRTFLVEMCAVAALWVILYEANGWLFSNLEVTKHINWIFLPAALRMLSVMLLNWSAVAGLFVGAMITNHPVIGENMSHAIVGSALTAFGPYLATHLTSSLLRTSCDFGGLRPRDLYFFALAGSLWNAVPHCVWFDLEGAKSPWTEHFAPMLIGDMLGSILALHTTSFALKLHRNIK